MLKCCSFQLSINQRVMKTMYYNLPNYLKSLYNFITVLLCFLKNKNAHGKTFWATRQPSVSDSALKSIAAETLQGILG